MKWFYILTPTCINQYWIYQLFKQVKGIEFINSNAKRIRRKNNHKESSFFQKYNYEIVVLFLFVTGIFLLLEKMKIKRVIFNIFQGIIIYIKNIIVAILSFIATIVSSIEISDLVGTIFILIALIMIFRRIRLRIFQRFSQLSECPKCGQDLQRAHRTIKQKLLGWILYAKVKRFSCNKCNYHHVDLRHFK